MVTSDAFLTLTLRRARTEADAVARILSDPGTGDREARALALYWMGYERPDYLADFVGGFDLGPGWAPWEAFDDIKPETPWDPVVTAQPGDPTVWE